jgi:FAD/FMN-containing dehydrogenase
VLPGTTRAYLTDATESRNLRGKADAIALPANAQQTADIVRWCYDHDVPIVPPWWRAAPEAGCAAIEYALASGVVPAALEYLDAGAVTATRGAFPVDVPDDARFMVIADADGTADEAAHIHAELTEVLAENALLVHAPTDAAQINALWRWRDGASLGVW